MLIVIILLVITVAVLLAEWWNSRTKAVYPSKKWCKRAEKAGLYVREIDEPTDLGWFLMNLDYHLHLFRKAINKLSEGNK